MDSKETSHWTKRHINNNNNNNNNNKLRTKCKRFLSEIFFDLGFLIGGQRSGYV